MTDSNRQKLAIFYEHPEWFKPMFAELDRRGIEYDRQLAYAHHFDPAQRHSPYALVAVPLLVETGFGALVHRVLVVDCPRATQLARLMARDRQTQADAERILAAQTSREARLEAADDVIDNSGDLEQLLCGLVGTDDLSALLLGFRGDGARGAGDLIGPAARFFRRAGQGA